MLLRRAIYSLMKQSIMEITLKKILRFISNTIFLSILISIIGFFVYKYASTFNLSEIGTGKIHCDLNENLRACRFTPIDNASLSAGIRAQISYNINYDEIDDNNKKYIGSNCSNSNPSSDGLCTFTVFGSKDIKNHSIKSIRLKMPE